MRRSGVRLPLAPPLFTNLETLLPQMVNEVFLCTHTALQLAQLLPVIKNAANTAAVFTSPEMTKDQQQRLSARAEAEKLLPSGFMKKPVKQLISRSSGFAAVFGKTSKNKIRSLRIKDKTALNDSVYNSLTK